MAFARAGRWCDGKTVGNYVSTRDLILNSWMVLFCWWAFNYSIFPFDAVWFIDNSAKDFDRWVWWIRDSCFVFNFWKSEIKIYVGRFWVLKLLLDLSFFACLMMVPTILLFFLDFFWWSCLLEYWIRSYVRGSLVWNVVKLILPGRWLHLSFRGH